MEITSRKLDTPAFLISLLGGFALVSLLAPLVAEATGMLRGVGMLFMMLGGWLIGWAARKFSSRWKQLFVVTSVVVVWYLLACLLTASKPEVFG
jgi:uncharacterized membrane protein AbrB (regulator of aidB expression)